jgi:predicted DsbA family dithiol-disulfide isomerase
VHSLTRGALTGAFITIALVACAQPPEEPASAAGAEVAARYGDTVITVADVEAEAGGQLVGLYQQIYQVKDQQLRQMIYTRLVEKAAAAEGLDSTAYLEREIIGKVGEPSEEQIAQVLNQYRSQLPPDDAQARQQVVAYLTQQARVQRETELRDQLFSAAGVEILLDPPRVKPEITAANPSRGKADAPVVLVEYTDYQCPFCVRAQPTIQAIRQRYGDSVVHVFKNLPLPMHQQARLAAEAALCAGDQGKFWELHDWLFANKDNISLDTLTVQAGELALDVPAFTACVNDGTHRAQVEADTAEANGFGIRGTPGFVLNGRVITGAQPLETFIAVIDDELKRKGLPLPGGQGAAPEAVPES